MHIIFWFTTVKGVTKCEYFYDAHLVVMPLTITANSQDTHVNSLK